MTEVIFGFARISDCQFRQRFAFLASDRAILAAPNTDFVDLYQFTWDDPRHRWMRTAEALDAIIDPAKAALYRRFSNFLGHPIAAALSVKPSRIR